MAKVFFSLTLRLNGWAEWLVWRYGGGEREVNGKGQWVFSFSFLSFFFLFFFGFSSLPLFCQSEMK